MATSTKSTPKRPSTRTSAKPRAKTAATSRSVATPRTQRRSLVSRISSIFSRSAKPTYVQIATVSLLLLPTVAAQLTLAYAPLAGVYVVAGALAFMIALGITLPHLRQACLASSVLLTSNFIILCIPHMAPLLSVSIFYLSMLALALTYRHLFVLDAPVQESSLKPSQYLHIIPTMLVLGQVLGAALYLVLGRYYSFASTPVGLVAALLPVFSIVEEVYFRGLVQHYASRPLGRKAAAIVSALLYATFCYSTLSVSAAILGLLIGATLSYVYYVRPNLVLTLTINIASKLMFIGLLATFSL